MKDENVSLRHGFIGIVIFVLSYGLSIAEPGNTDNNNAGFELKSGDRVVLLGNSLIQEDLHYGYIEYILTTRWPDRDITFRNLGWTGDTVYGEARSYYTTPPDEYELLIKQLREVKPTVVVIGYGANEAYKGEKGVPEFKEGLQTLLDDIEKMGARVILLSPIPELSTSILSSEKLSIRNKNLKLYASVISQMAGKRGIRYINLFDPFKKVGNITQLTNDGIHLNELGYFYLATFLEDELELAPRNWSVNLDHSNQEITATGPVTLLDSQFNKNNITFTAVNTIHPLPPPTTIKTANAHPIVFKITGLKKGCYTLSEGPNDVTSASAKRWSKGVEIHKRILFSQANELRELIIKKNRLYFRKYRPTNRTYLVGFRSFEQDQNKKELEQLELFISRLEDQISHLRKPDPKEYRVTAVK